MKRSEGHAIGKVDEAITRRHVVGFLSPLSLSHSLIYCRIAEDTFRRQTNNCFSPSKWCTFVVCCFSVLFSLLLVYSSSPLPPIEVALNKRFPFLPSLSSFPFFLAFVRFFSCPSPSS
ncbi:hypothetical protein F5H01DRAFT_346284 [Linnemannia elongata]|nr:hypothetical protein F5H01DRAFT_346284 [Linnemannia elongata]